jgi:predicted RNase H-like HicB family nuclease
MGSWSYYEMVAGTGMTKTFTILVYEAEEGGYWAECIELKCGSQGETLDELDFNIRESIEAVLQVRVEDGEDITAIEKAANVQAADNVRKWEISVRLPELAAA